MIRKLVKGVKVAKEPGFRRALRHGVAASIEHDAIPLPRDIAHVIDVGANRGQFLTWASVRFPEAKFDCFEPYVESRTVLERTLPKGRSVEIHPVALGESEDELAFHVTSDDDSSSLMAPSHMQTDAFPGSSVASTITVSVKRLDDVLVGRELSRPSLLKLDVQGGELAALRGATDTLQSIDFVVAECSFAELYVSQPLANEIVSFMADHGFRIAGYFSPTVIGGTRLVQADGLFCRE